MTDKAKTLWLNCTILSVLDAYIVEKDTAEKTNSGVRVGKFRLWL